jgi:hypothetical protein
MKIKAFKDPNSLGDGRMHFVFPVGSLSERIKAPISGGIWIAVGTPIPDEITIILKGTGGEEYDQR